jgi:hypothetical protein
MMGAFSLAPLQLEAVNRAVEAFQATLAGRDMIPERSVARHQSDDGRIRALAVWVMAKRAMDTRDLSAAGMLEEIEQLLEGSP